MAHRRQIKKKLAMWWSGEELWQNKRSEDKLLVFFAIFCKAREYTESHLVSHTKVFLLN
jgi:hypothetical protein